MAVVWAYPRMTRGGIYLKIVNFSFCRAKEKKRKDNFQVAFWTMLRTGGEILNYSCLLIFLFV